MAKNLKKLRVYFSLYNDYKEAKCYVSSFFIYITRRTEKYLFKLLFSIFFSFLIYLLIIFNIAAVYNKGLRAEDPFNAFSRDIKTSIKLRLYLL